MTPDEQRTWDEMASHDPLAALIESTLRRQAAEIETLRGLVSRGQYQHVLLAGIDSYVCIGCGVLCGDECKPDCPIRAALGE